MQHVRLTVTCGNCEQVIDTFINEVAEKYPFYCPHCDMQTTGKHPFVITAEIADDSANGA